MPFAATSTDAERAFSRGGLTVSRLRHSLGDASIRASALLGSWARVDGIVDEADAVEILKTKLRDSRVKDEATRAPRATKPRAAIPQPSEVSVPVKVKQEPISDDDTRPVNPRAKAKGASSVPKPHPVGKSGTSTPSASSAGPSAVQASALPPPLVRRKSSKANVSSTRHADRKGKRAARVPLDSTAIEISSDEPEPEDD